MHLYVMHYAFFNAAVECPENCMTCDENGCTQCQSGTYVNSAGNCMGKLDRVVKIAVGTAFDRIEIMT